MKPKKAQIIASDGLVPYEEAHQRQLALVRERKADRIPNTLYLVEHPPVITLGKHADTAGVVAPKQQLSAANIPVIRVERGGQATYHGPGQLVGYPVLNLHELGLGAARYVQKLETVLMQTAEAFGIRAHRREKTIGLFTERGKLGAIGVRISQGITFHGFALNIAPNLNHYQWIIPCGLAHVPVTSFAELLDAPPPMSAVRERIAAIFLEVFGFERQ